MLELHYYPGMNRIFFLNGEDCLEVDLEEYQTVYNSPAKFVREYRVIQEIVLEDFLRIRSISLEQLLSLIQDALKHKGICDTWGI